MGANPLKDIIVAEIQASGPLSVARYMELCLTHPEHGYYTTRDPLGAKGDFVTAPEISQVFGELIGLWILDRWDRMGRPGDLRLVELGPGRGTLMGDALRAMNALPGCPHDLYLIESSPILRAVQEARLEATWIDTVDDVPPGPVILVANEFFDALPVDQFEKTGDGWRMMMVDAENGQLVRLPGDIVDVPFPDDPVGSVREKNDTADALAGSIATRLNAQGGAALVIDYGYEKSAPGDSLQALQSGTYADPFAAPGEADLTCHVDFCALGAAASEAGAQVHGPVDQGTFLEALGLFARADALKKNAAPAQRREIDTAMHRLTAPDQMGNLFKVLAITPPGSAPPAGF